MSRCRSSLGMPTSNSLTVLSTSILEMWTTNSGGTWAGAANIICEQEMSFSVCFNVREAPDHPGNPLIRGDFGQFFRNVLLVL